MTTMRIWAYCVANKRDHGIEMYCDRIASAVASYHTVSEDLHDKVLNALGLRTTETRMRMESSEAGGIYSRLQISLLSCTRYMS